MGMNTNPAGLVQSHIGTAYDNVKKVADNLEGITQLSSVINEGIDLTLLAQVLNQLGDAATDLAELAASDLSDISVDLDKGNYLGNRKIDIDLTLNNSSTTTEVTYQGITIVTSEGVSVPINFETVDGNGDPVVEELSSYTAIYNALTAGIAAYNTDEPDSQLHITDTEIDIINSTLPDVPTVLRLRDRDGGASNVDRLVLHTYSGPIVEINPSYYWAKTTSALQTLANRVGDVIALGQDIDSIIRLATLTDEIDYLYADREKLTGATDSIYSELTKLVTLHGSISQIETDALTATNKAAEATTSAATAVDAAQTATTKANEIQTVTVGNTVTGSPGQNASVVYNPGTGEFTFIIPEGEKGDKGEAFLVNAVGLFASRSIYDDQPYGFSFLSGDTGNIYFKLSNTSGDWSSGAPFGKGDKGDTGTTGNGVSTIVFDSTTHGNGLPNQLGATDTYEITFTDTTTTTFDVVNGNAFVPSDAINDAGTDADKAWSGNKVSNELLQKAPVDAPAFTGAPTAPTASQGTNTNQLATTAFVEAAKLTKASQATVSAGTNDTEFVTASTLKGAIDAGLAGKKILNIGIVSNSTTYTRASTSEGTVSVGLSIPRSSLTSKAVVIWGSSMEVHHTSGGNDARGAVNLRYYDGTTYIGNSVSGRGNTASIGAVNTAPVGSGNCVFSYDQLSGSTLLTSAEGQVGDDTSWILGLTAGLSYGSNYMTVFGLSITYIEYEDV